MKVLHLLMSEPDETVEKLTEMTFQEHEASVAVLYQGDIDWPKLVDNIFSHDKVICWP